MCPTNDCFLSTIGDSSIKQNESLLRWTEPSPMNLSNWPKKVNSDYGKKENNSYIWIYVIDDDTIKYFLPPEADSITI